ncbi:BLUF domain-containing protein [Tardiphaga sp. 20_F10_N6_6]|uniref:BLUF domain-containing protein n=1 Tax=Tardiphaga robiniae TaxID=943830 RepID=A0A7G6U184_9BRAD|nr:BLUF domain-containing protein [Tardiphaga robiniae]QND72766.1 BLUF domain-containing protein [Tardiphaga robiniae]
MFRILYLSTANEPFSSGDLSELLQKARARNDAAHITGMLVHSDGDFLQVLEGEPDNVIEVYSRISVDPRHRDISLLQRGLAYGDRLFPNWAMGFKRVPDQTLVNEAVGLNGRVKLRYLDAMSALDFLLACSQNQT